MFVAALLTLLTGLVLGQLVALVVPPFQSPSVVSTNSAQNLMTARSFYDGLNRLASTGDRAIETALALDFVDYTAALPSKRNAEQLIADWFAIGSLLPHLQLDVVDMHASGSLVTVWLDIRPGSAASIPGLPLAAPVAGSAVEILRIENATVAERWSSDDRLPNLSTTFHADFVRSGPTSTGPVIQRLSLAAGEELTLSGDDTVVLRVVSGEIRLDRPTVDPQRGLYPTSDPVTSGQVRVVEGADTLLLRNLSSVTAEILAFGLYGLDPVESSPSPPATAVTPAEIDTKALAYMPLQLPGGSADRLRMTVTEVTLPAGAWVAPHTPGLVEQIVVLDGTVEANVQSGRALLSNGDGQSRPFVDIENASAGHGFSASSVATLSYRVVSAQPATLLIMTIEPAPSPGEDEDGCETQELRYAHLIPSAHC